MAISWDTLRVGHRYYVQNFGEMTQFIIVEALYEDYLVQDTLTLERFPLSDLTRYGKGEDYDLQPA